MDRRIKRSRKLLSQAFLELLKKRAFDEISIRDITDYADVAYSTFFRNFESKEALILNYLEELAERIALELKELQQASLREKSHFLVYELFESVRECPNTFRILAANPETLAVLKQFKGRVIALNAEIFKPLRPHFRSDIPPLDLVMNNAAVQTLGLLEWWIDSGLPVSTATLCQYYETLVLEPTLGILLGENSLREEILL